MNREMMITMVTTITDDMIRYEVVDGCVEAGDFGDARTVWSRDVPLMQTAAYRAGGYHATEAAREQEAFAMELANKYAEGFVQPWRRKPIEASEPGMRGIADE